MADVRIQDFNENQNPNANDDYLMTFNANSESKTRLRDAFYGMIPDGAGVHNSIFRGKNLGALTATHIANIKNGTFKNMFIGDFFNVNGTNYCIAGFNYKYGHGDNGSLGNHAVLIPNSWSQTLDQTLSPNKSSVYMNDENSAAGGFANTKLYKTYIPQIQRKLEEDFGSNLLSFRTVISTHLDASGAPDQGEWRSEKVGIPNEVMIYGTTLNGNNKNSSFYNIGDENIQLPLMRLSYGDTNNWRAGAFWLRDVHSATEFTLAGADGSAGFNGASYTNLGIKAYFLIG